MEQSQYLMDSNAVIDYLAGKFPKSGMAFVGRIVDMAPQISIITKIEILGYKTTPEADLLLTSFVDASIVLPLSNPIVNQTIALRKKLRIKVPDAIIAATALTHQCILLTHNTDDFKNIAGLKCIDAHCL